MIRFILPACGARYKTRHDVYLALPYIDRSSFALGLLRPFFSLEFAPSNVQSNTVLDSGFQIAIVSEILDSYCRILNPKALNSKFHKQKFPWISHSTSKNVLDFGIPITLFRVTCLIPWYFCCLAPQINTERPPLRIAVQVPH